MSGALGGESEELRTDRGDTLNHLMEVGVRNTNMEEYRDHELI